MRLESPSPASQNAGQKVAVTTELLAQAQKQERRTDEMAKVGELSRQAVAAARLETVNTQLARLDALLKLQQAAATLENALQLPLELPESLINAPVQSPSQP